MICGARETVICATRGIAAFVLRVKVSVRVNAVEGTEIADVLLESGVSFQKKLNALEV